MIKRSLRRIGCLVLIVTLLMGTSLAAQADPILGDVDASGEVNPTDALLVLQHHVDLITLPPDRQILADVDENHEISPVDALLLLQFYVSELPALGKEALLDHAYGVTGKDFLTPVQIEDYHDANEVIEKLGGTPEAADVEGYPLNQENKLIYNPISREAEKTGRIDRYQNVPTISGKLELGGTVLSYTLPRRMTAYDAVPIYYTIDAEDDSDTLHLGVTTFEEQARTNGNAYYDLNLPNLVDFAFTYEGYVNGTLDADKKPHLSAETDKQGTAYPSYDRTDLIPSGTIQAADITWLKFSYTNIGNTIVDGEGNGSFRFEPILYKKDETGTYVKHDTTINQFERIFDYIYPGETNEIWISFQSYGYEPGEYRVDIRGLVGNERSNTPNWNQVFQGGYLSSVSSFSFTVTEDGAMTTPSPVVHQLVQPCERNNWLGVFEEFQSSYMTTGDYLGHKEGVLYFQPAPWNEAVTLKLMTRMNDDMVSVRIPVEVESDSIQIQLNEKNENYHILPDGTRTPLIAAQSMADMRANVHRGPDAASTIINDLRDMQEAGINFLSTTMSFGYDTSTDPSLHSYDANKFMLDVARTMDFDLEGYSCYPYNWSGSYAAGIGATELGDASRLGWTDPKIDTANARMADYTYQRYGDFFYTLPNGTIPITAEDTRGWLRIDLSSRYPVSSAFCQNLGAWLQGHYKTINRLNEAYGFGANYTGFDRLDPQAEAFGDGIGLGFVYSNQTKPYHDWAPAITDLDLYRTVERADNYRSMLAQTHVPNAKMIIRTEGANWMVAGIDPTTTNDRYRHVYYNQRRVGMVAEIMQSSNTVIGHSDYVNLAFSPSEVYELTKRSTQQGITSMALAQFNRMRDIAINPLYGNPKYVTEYNLKTPSMRGAYLCAAASLFTWFKAAYEGGGIPGLLWQDYLCDGMVTSTQFKELKFFKQKIEEMLQTKEGIAWSHNFNPSNISLPEGKWSYPEEYIRQLVRETDRVCVFTYRQSE